MLLPEQVMMAFWRSIAQAALAGAAAAAADHKGEQDRGILGEGEGLEVALVVVVVILVVISSLHEREGSGELAHVDGRHGTTERNSRPRSGWSYGCWLGSRAS